MNTLRHRLNLPLTQALSSHNLTKNDSLDRINTHHSTQQTARQSTNRNSYTNISHLQTVKNHITLIESAESGYSARQRSLRRSSSGQINGRQRQMQQYKKVKYEQQETGRSKSQRRRKIFDNSYLSRSKNQLPSYTSSAVRKTNAIQQNQEPFAQQNSLPPSMVYKAKPIRFIDTIPVVQKRLINVRSLNHLNNTHTLNKSPNRITFTYTKGPLILNPPQHRVQPQPQPLNLPRLSQQFYRSTALPILSVGASQENHANPAIKIKKPKPTNIKQMSIKNKDSPSKVMASNVSLKNNICESLIRGYSLATDKHLHDESFSEIQEDNSNRYYDSGDEDKLLIQKISYKNIDIDNHSDHKAENSYQIHSKNIFEDFQRRRNEHEHSVRNGHQQSIRHTSLIKRVDDEKVDKSKLQVPKQETQKQNSNILQRQSFIIESKAQGDEYKIGFPLLLVGLAFLLFLIQLVS